MTLVVMAAGTGSRFGGLKQLTPYAKRKQMSGDARSKLRETLQRIINEGSGGLICIIL